MFTILKGVFAWKFLCLKRTKLSSGYFGIREASVIKREKNIKLLRKTAYTTDSIVQNRVYRLESQF